MLRVKKAAIVSLALTSVLVLGACTAPGATDPGAATDGPIVIGMATAKTGWMGPYDKGPDQAFKMKIDEVNAAGGVLGRQIEIITGDNQTDPAQSKVVAADLIAQGAEIIVGSCNYDIGGPAGVEAQSSGLLGLTACAGSPRWGVQGIGEFAFNAATATYAEGAVLSEFATEKGWSKPYVLVDTTLDYDKELCQGFSEYWTDQLGGTIAGTSEFQNGDTAIPTQISDIQASGADSIVICTYNPGGATAVRNIRAAGVDLPIMSGFGMSGNYWLEAVPDLSDFYTNMNACIIGDDPDPKVNAFVEGYIEKYGEDPVGYDTGLINGYVLAEVVVAAIEQAGGKTDGASLAAVLNTFTDFPSLLSTTYTPEVHINSQRPLRILEYQNGVVKCADKTYKATKPVDLHLG